jgi:hypothetical protein
MRETLRNLAAVGEILLWRDGGQRQARRNAWTAMVVDTGRARERADAAAAFAGSIAGTPTVPMAR